jgi:hypothetical protein
MAGLPHPCNPADRARWLAAEDAALLRDCRIDLFVGTGRGGQKRNKTETAVRLTHLPSGQTGTSDETRSQHTNKHLALRALRRQIALHCRISPPAPYAGLWAPALTNDEAYAGWLAAVLDQLAASGWQVAAAAAALGQSTSGLVKALARDSQAWQGLGSHRREAGLPALRFP